MRPASFPCRQQTCWQQVSPAMHPLSFNAAPRRRTRASTCSCLTGTSPAVSGQPRPIKAPQHSASSSSLIFGCARFGAVRDGVEIGARERLRLLFPIRVCLARGSRWGLTCAWCLGAQHQRAERIHRGEGMRCKGTGRTLGWFVQQFAVQKSLYADSANSSKAHDADRLCQSIPTTKSFTCERRKKLPVRRGCIITWREIGRGSTCLCCERKCELRCRATRCVSNHDHQCNFN